MKCTSPCNFRAHTCEDLYAHICTQRKWIRVLSRCKHRSECTQSQGVSTDVHGVWGCKRGGSVPSAGIARGGKREGEPVFLAHAPTSSWAFSLPALGFFSAAEQTPCLQGRCLMSQIQSLECLISCGQACFWQLTFPTACCWKTHTPQTINTMLKT